MYTDGNCLGLNVDGPACYSIWQGIRTASPSVVRGHAREKVLRLIHCDEGAPLGSGLEVCLEVLKLFFCYDGVPL